MSVSPSKYSGVTWNFSASVVAQRQSILFFPDSQNETALGEMPNISAISFCVIRLAFRSSFSRFMISRPFIDFNQYDFIFNSMKRQ